MNVFEMIQAELSNRFLYWFNLTIQSLPSLVVSLFILIFFYLIAKGSRVITPLVFKKILKSTQIKILLTKMIQWIILCIGLFIALEILNLDKTVTSLLAGAGVLGLALGFAFQSIVSNFITSILLSVQSPFKIGDTIAVNEVTGQAMSINLRTTVIQTFDGQIVNVPNKIIFENNLINYSRIGLRRIGVDIGVAYQSDLDLVEKLTMKTIYQLKPSQKKPIQVLFHTFADSSINLTAYFWIPFKSEADYQEMKSSAIKNIKLAFEKNDIDIPFPITTVHLKK